MEVRERGSLGDSSKKIGNSSIPTLNMMVRLFITKEEAGFSRPHISS
jgi:hypothetical protein